MKCLNVEGSERMGSEVKISVRLCVLSLIYSYVVFMRVTVQCVWLLFVLCLLLFVMFWLLVLVFYCSFYVCFLVLYSLLSTLCVLCFCIVLCIVSPDLYCFFLSIHLKLSDNCQQVETQLQLIDILSYRTNSEWLTMVPKYSQLSKWWRNNWLLCVWVSKMVGGTQWICCLRHSATGRNVAGSILMKSLSFLT